MKIHNRTVIDMATGQVLEDDFFEYEGPLALCTHGKEKQITEDRQKLQDKRTQKAFDLQMSNLNDIKTNFSKYLSGNVGFDPQQLALMKSQFQNQDSANFNNARQQTLSSLLARGSGGGQAPAGGDFARGLSGLYGAEANSRSSGLANINMSNLQQMLTNKFNTANLLSGNAATLSNPISTFTNSADNALDQRVKVGMAPGFGSSFLNSFGSVLGGGLGAGVTGGVGTLASKAGSGNYGW